MTSKACALLGIFLGSGGPPIIKTFASESKPKGDTFLYHSTGRALKVESATLGRTSVFHIIIRVLPLFLAQT